MTYLRIWDEQFQFLHSATGDDAELVTAAEQFMAERTEPWLHYTLDTTPGGSFTTRRGGQLIRTEDGIEWRDHRAYLQCLMGAPYSLPVTVRPGDKMAVRIGDEIFTDTIESVRTTTPACRPQPEPSRWRRILRTLTPRRWRKTRLWSPPGGNSQTVITTVSGGEPYILGQDIVLGERTDWRDIVAEMAQSESDTEDQR